MIAFIEEYAPYIFMALSAFLAVLNMVYTRITGKKIDTEVNMKFRSPFYRESTPSPEQDFSPLVKTYRLDKTTDQLVEADTIDVDKLIASHMDSALERMLERFMPVDVSAEIKGEIDDTESDLASVGAALDLLCDYRDNLGLDPFCSAEDVVAAMEKKRADLLEQQKAVEALKLKKTEVDDNAHAEE